ncbi:MAG TPA: alpha/beta hydrolase [Gemmatimonadaceae bacterium]|nr:alpha/beta hydrolase [Gemmatimonadaceae bacterium]
MTRMTLLVGTLLLFAGGNAGAQERMLNVGDAVISYDVTGRGTPLVFIHGWTHNKSVWDDQVPVFSKRYRVVRYDSRGFGKSTGFADESAEPLDLLILLEALRTDRAYIVGHSRGGGVALRFAAAYPERVAGLVLYGAVPPADFHFPPEFGQLFGSLPGIAKLHGLDSVWKLLMTTDLAWMPPERKDVSERLRKLWASYSGKDLLDPHPESGKVPLPNIARLSSLGMPTLVIIGDHELPFLAAAADTFANRIPNVTKVVIPDAGHGAHFAQPATFNSALLDFLDEVERTRRDVERKRKR